MPRLIKKKYSQRLGEGDGERVGGGDGARPDHQDVGNLLEKQRLLLMSGRLPALTPRPTTTNRADNIPFPDTTDAFHDPLVSKVRTSVVKRGQNVGETQRGQEVKGGSGGDVLSQANQRCTVELGEEEASGFRRRLSAGAKRVPAQVDSTSSPGVLSRHQVGFSGAKKAMSDRLTGQRSQVQRGSISGRFNDGPEKEASSYFTKMKIFALNESSSDDSESEVEMESSKEAQEAEAYTLYNKALDLQRAGDNAEAESTYQQLLNIPLLAEVEPPEDNKTLMNPGLMLKYSTYKNLGSMAYQKKDLNKAMKHYLEAVSLDETDVTVWYRIGTIAVTLYQLPLARLSFIQALKCSSKHWPSLDNLCTVLYALNDYATCLYYICQALERDCKYRKGVVLREKMFKEQPSLRKDSYDLFRNCQDAIHHSQIEKGEAERIVKDALTLREERRALAKQDRRPLVKFLTSFTSFTWKDLGERLAALYDHLASSSPPLSVCCKIDLSEFIQHPDERESTADSDNQETPMGVPRDTPQDTPQDTPRDTPRDTSQDTPPGNTQSGSSSTESQAVSREQNVQQIPGDDQISPETPRQTLQENSEQSEQQTAQQNPTETPGETPQHTPQQTQQQTPMETSEQTQQQTPQQTTPLTSDQMQRHSPQLQTAEQTLQQTSQQIPVQSPQQTPRQISDRTPQWTPQHSPSHIHVLTHLETPQTTQQTPQQTTPHTPQQTTPHTPQQTTTHTPQQTTQQTSLTTPQQTPLQTQVRSSDMEDSSAMETEAVLVKKKVRRGPKRKREKADNPVPGNRRSTRVRNTTGKKKEESVNYQEILRQFLPSSLQDSGDGEDMEDTDCTSSGKDEMNRQSSHTSSKTETSGQARPIRSVDSDTGQSERVWSFLATRQRNSGIIQVLHEYLQEVAALRGTWPTGLSSVFLQGYSRTRRHIILPNIFSSEYSNNLKTSIGYMMLTFAELKIDQLISAGKKTPSSASKKADLEAMGKFIDEDLGYIQMLTTSGAVQEDRWRDFTVRVYWLKARYMTLQGKPDESINSFDVCTDILTESPADDGTDSIVILPNCSVDNRITVDLIKEQLKSTQHSQSLEEVQRFYEAGNYERVTTLLLPTFRDASSSRKILNEGAPPQRPSQLLLLHQSLLKLNNYKQCVVCGAASISEALQEVSVAKTTLLRDEWINVLMELFTTINKALCEDMSSLKQLDYPQRVGLTTAVISVIEMCMDTDSNYPQDVLPWVVLYRLIKHEEDQIASKEISTTMATQDGGGRSSTPMIPSSLMLLDTAHDHLGRRSWCCNSDGAFLRLYIAVLSREIAMGTEDDPHPFLNDLQYSLEQCFFCLHGHPSKKTKARHLQDHGVDELPMDLEDASIIFDYFKPSILPEFDSYKTSSMSGDLESLLLKIVRIIPPMEDPPITMETLQSYIDAKMEVAPSIPKDRPIIRPVVKEIYYLLADFYFKNKEFFKAIKLYMQDICVCPERLDSWAGMALARSGRLELKFNMCDSKTEGTIYKHSVAALRCFQRALEIDSTNRSLWIEYGSMAYMVHSYASRQLKQRDQFSLTEDIVEFLQEKRSECLVLAEKCFQEALQCEVDGEEEEWLVHYMLGKVSEKRLENPQEFLEHYKKAAHYLHEDEAKYPKKIAYHNPPDLSLEALEMYFRLHASILKLLEKPDKHFHGDYAMLQRYVLDAIEEPFVTAQEKVDTSEPLSSAEIDPDIKSPFPSVRGQPEDKGQEVKLEKPRVPGSPMFIATPTDHDYVRSRSRKRQHVKTMTDDPFSEFLPSSHDEQTSSSSVLPSHSKDAISSATSAAELLKSLAKIHTDILVQAPPAKRQCIEHPTRPEMAEKDVGMSTKPPADSEGFSPPTRDKFLQSLAQIHIDILDQPTRETRQEGGQSSVQGLDKKTSTGLDVRLLETGEGRKGFAESLVDPEEGVEEKRNEVGKPPEKGNDDEVVYDPTSEAQKEETLVTENTAAQMKRKTETSIIIISSEDSEDQMDTEESLTAKKETLEPLPRQGVSERGETGIKQKDVVQEKRESESNISIITISSEDSEDQMDLEESATRNKDREEEPVDGSKMDAKETAEEANRNQEEAGDSTMKKETVEKLGEGLTGEEETYMKHDPKDETLADEDLRKPSDGRQEDVKEAERGQDEKRAWLMERCLEAMKLCLTRFPQHYKSLYRMAHTYSVTPTNKSLQWSRDLLLGSNQSWQQASHMPSPGLFAEHWKTKNLFHGVWRIPISEIDRSGSFSWHMYRSVNLLIDILRRLKDHTMLLQIAVKLNRTPELGKKFLRDVDRQYLAKHCYKTCLELLEEEINATGESDKEQQLQAVLSSYRLLQTVQNKLQMDARLPTKLLCHAFKTFRNIQMDSDVIILDQAVRFCLQHRMITKAPQTPTSQQELIFSSPQQSREKILFSPDRHSDAQGGTSSSTQ